MKLHRITFALCYYLGLYPFRYYDTVAVATDGAKPFRVTSRGILFKSSIVLFLLVQFAYKVINILAGTDFTSRVNRVPDHKWIDLLPYWHLIQYIFAIYCLIWTTTPRNVRFFNDSLRPFESVRGRPFDNGYFLALSGLNVAAYFWFNSILARLTGSTRYFETFAVLHHDLIFVAFESLVLFVLNGARVTLKGTEHRLRSIHKSIGLGPLLSQLTAEQRRQISTERMLHFECTSIVENLINEFKFPLLFVIADNYIIMVSYSYMVTVIVYLHLWQNESNDLVIIGSTVLYITTKIIRLWILCDVDNQLNEQVKIFLYQCSVKPVKLTVAGLFNLDTNFLQSALGAALAYVVLMLQSSHVDLPRELKTSLISDENFTTPGSVSCTSSSPFDDTI